LTEKVLLLIIFIFEFVEMGRGSGKLTLKKKFKMRKFGNQLSFKEIKD
jgi:hypothetical protein